MENRAESVIDMSLMRQIVDNLTDTVYVCDFATDELYYMNKAAMRLSECEFDPAAHKKCHEVILCSPFVCSFCMKSRIPAEGAHTEYILSPANGHVYCTVGRRAVWNGYDAVLYTVTDDTKMVENNDTKALLYQGLVDESSTSVIAVEKASRKILFANRAWYRQEGLQSGVEAVGHTLQELLPQDKVFFNDADVASLPVDRYAQSHQKSSTGRALNVCARSMVWDGKQAYICYINDESELWNARERLQARIKSMDAIDDDNLIAKGRHDITRNAVIEYSEKSPLAVHVTAGEKYDVALERLSETVIGEDRKREMEEMFARERLLCDFAGGKREGEFSYKRHSVGKAAIWSRLSYTLVEDPDTGDVVMFIYSHDVSDRMQENHILRRLGSLEYDMVGLLDKDTRHYQLKNVHEKETCAAASEGDFDRLVRDTILADADENEKPALSGSFSVPEIISHIQKTGRYSISFSVMGNRDAMQRKRYQFCYLDETDTTVLFYRSDVTELYNREQEQLRKTEAALAKATRASTAKTEFFSHMSHDMRTPMNAILGMANLAQTERDPENVRRYMEKIITSGNYLLGLLNDALDFQTIETGNVPLEKKTVNARDLIGGLTDMIAMYAKEKGVDFEILTGNIDMDWDVCVDVQRIRQIFANLLNNAVKFTPAGGKVTLSLSCLSRQGMMSKMEIVVADTGIGMSEQFMQHGLFHPFKQESNAVTDTYAGTGLGLPVAKQLVEMMGGTIALSSQKGEGTTVTVQLQVERVDHGNAQYTQSENLRHSGDVMQALHGKRVLLAEDHPLNAEIARKLLERAQCVTDWAHNGQECVDMFLSSAPYTYDAVLMDIRMPVMDGLAAAKALRAMKRSDAQRVPILAMTANSYAEDMALSMQAGMNGHLAKPIEPIRLYEALSDLIVHANKM